MLTQEQKIWRHFSAHCAIHFNETYRPRYRIKNMRKTCCNDCNAMTITLSCCRKLHKLEPRHYCNSMIENICNKSAAKHHLKGNFCPRKVWGNFLQSQQSFLPISSPEPIRHFFLPEHASRLGANNKKLK